MAVAVSVRRRRKRSALQRTLPSRLIRQSHRDPELFRRFTAELFQAIYLALLGKPRGPRAGWFVAALGAECCAARFREAAGERT